MEYDNHFLFSETFLNDTLKKMSKSEIAEADEQFKNILSWYQECKDEWESYEDILIDTLGFSKDRDGQFRILYSENAEPIAIAYLLGKESDLGSTAYAIDVVQKVKTISYKKLRKLLIDRNMTKSDLRDESGISTASLAKLGRDDNITTAVLLKICTALNCDISDIMEVVDADTETDSEKE
jgi:putative transcriptional regulator